MPNQNVIIYAFYVDSPFFLLSLPTFTYEPRIAHSICDLW